MEDRTRHLENAAEFCRAQRCEEAITELEAVVHHEPDNAEIHYQLGYCYSGGCRTHSLTQADIALEHFRQARSHSRTDADSCVQARILGALGNAYLHSSLPRELGLKAALECHAKAAEILRLQGDRDGWAREQYNLGNAWCEAPSQDFPDMWQEAIRHFKKALEVRTREHSPERHAAILQNLGTAYRELLTGDRTASVRKAIHCYHRALRVYTSKAFPLKYAALQNNLGNAFLTLAYSDQGSRERHARRALRHLGLALRIWTKEEHPCSHAVASFNRGNALVLTAECEIGPLATLQQSAICFQQAAKCFRTCGNTANAENADARIDQIRSCLRAA